ncbi:hypothetical protein JMJ77_0013230, partial [Colletotrichum scovillei]
MCPIKRQPVTQFQKTSCFIDRGGKITYQKRLLSRLRVSFDIEYFTSARELLS